MHWTSFNDLSLKRKILMIALTTSALSLVLACSLILLNEWLTYPRIMKQNLLNLAQIVGDNCTAALSFNDNKTAQEVVETLKANPHIRSAVLFDGKGRIAAVYLTEKLAFPTSLPSAQGEEIQMNSEKAWLYHYILSGKERIGTLYLESDTGELRTRLMGYAATTAGVLVLSFLISLGVAGRLQRRVTGPLHQVVKKLKEIARGEGNLTERIKVEGRDEIGQVADYFNTYVDKLQAVDEMKQNIISVVSHQLKTPVAEINGYIENLLEGLAGELGPKQRQYLQDMKEIGKENYRMICDLLSVSKIDRGVISVNLAPAHVSRLVELAVRDYEETIRRKGLSLVFEGLSKDLEVLVDRDKIVETIRNLVNNAVKFTDHGSITIAVRDAGESVTIEVSDTGLGMGPEALERVFTKSRVLGEEASRSGAGLGLYIARHFMRLQNGEITVTAEKGKGARFRLTIPKAKGPEGGVL